MRQTYFRRNPNVTQPTRQYYDTKCIGDCDKLEQHHFNVIANLPNILKDSGEIGELELDIFKFIINSLDTYEKDYIVCEKQVIFISVIGVI